MIPINNEMLRFIGALRDKPLVGPRTITLRITNQCDLSCIYCWYHYPARNKHPAKFLDYGKIAEIINDCKKLGTDHICISGAGEPTLHPRIADIIRLAKSSNISLSVLSNGAWGNGLWKAAHLMSSIRVNLSASHRESYKRIHRADLFNKVMKNLLLLARLKEKKMIGEPVIEVVSIINRMTYKELPRILSICREIGAERFNMKMMSPTKDTSGFSLTKEDAEALKNILESMDMGGMKSNFAEIRDRLGKEGFICKHEDYDPYDPGYFSNFVNIGRDFRCYIGYYQAQINLQGDVSLCCMNNASRIGNIFQKSFFQIWKSKEAEDFRRNAKYHFDLDDIKWERCHECLWCGLWESLNNKMMKYMERLKPGKKTAEVNSIA